MLELSTLSVSYGEAAALVDVSLEVPQGSVVALIGSNGAGKTTLVHSVMGMLPVRAGEIRFEGEDITSLAAHHRPGLGISLVPEGRRLIPGMSVKDNLLLGLHDAGARKRSDDGMEWVLDLFPVLADRSRQLAGTMSGGEQQMVALARALVARPKLLLLDEPSLGLAPVIVAQVFDLVRKVKEEGVTILIAEQNVRQTLRLSDHGYVLEEGRVGLDAPAAELNESPEVRAAYLGGE